MAVQIGEIVVYGANGVCHVDDVRTEKMGTEMRTYYILKPIRNGSSTIFVPKDNRTLVEQMKCLLTPDGLHALLRQTAEQAEEEWIADARVRGEHYKSVLVSGDRFRILSALRALYIRRIELGAKGKQLCASDENFFYRSEEIFVDEISVVFALSRDGARAFLYRGLGLEK